MRRALSFGRLRSGIPRNWRQETTADGECYFVNVLTRERSYSLPRPLPRPWRESLEKATGKVYYWNPRTHAVRWTRPEADKGGGEAASEPDKGGDASPDEAVPPAPPTPAPLLPPPPLPTTPPPPPPPLSAPPPPPPTVPPLAAAAPPPATAAQKVSQRVASFGRSRGRRGEAKKGATRAAAADEPPAVSASRGDGVAAVTTSSSGLGALKKLDVKDFTFSGRSGEVLIKKPGQVGGQQFIIEECEDCDIFILDWSGEPAQHHIHLHTSTYTYTHIHVRTRTYTYMYILEW